MSRPGHRTAARNYLPESKLEDLAIRLRRLANHRGLVRREITSPLLLRLLPAPLRGDAGTYESDLRRTLKDANLDADRVAYLLAHAEQEIHVAHARLAG
ncbi:hypothetical protein [Methylorubrum salsuginis]|uniref:Uncharacterized protein n=1 Tax=Methylorubrum salsuginis TaxID=414703 RepID=A0A1I4ACI3_9HYPH|nr:hypothetical protein [Methylorubrum salsuginis]SFK54118.1 hypothetical protein SAMN04488125_102341 [Methylorubrum salsuginis]